MPALCSRRLGTCLLLYCLLNSLAAQTRAAEIHDAARTVEVQGVGATVADRNPFVSLIASRAAPLCTGSLVAPTAVLTTAACASGLENGAGKPEIVFVGAFNSFLDQFRREGRYDIRQVAHVRLHPGWKPSAPRENNLALLLLRRPSKLQPVAVAGADFAYPLNASDAAAFGFGSLSADGVWPQLHSDQLTLLPQEECRGLQTAYGPRPQSQEQACTALSHNFRACASGNVGAPLLLPAPAAPGSNGTAGGAVLAAVLTGGFACSDDPSVASPSSPALYEWLPRHAAWLQEQLGNLGSVAKQDLQQGSAAGWQPAA